MPATDDIAVLISGGVDSSVVVHLLCEQGYHPSLFYIKIGMEGADFMDCPMEEDMEMVNWVGTAWLTMRWRRFGRG